MTRTLDDEFPIRTFADPADFDRAREWFGEVGFTQGVLPRELGIEAKAPPGEVEGRALAARLESLEPVTELLRLFVLGQPLDAGRARKALGPVAPERWAEAGVLVADGDGWRCPVRLAPFPGEDPGWCVSDSADSHDRPDYIMPPTFAASDLADLMVRTPADSLLDLGTGGGFLAILGAGFARDVTATDLCPRALPLTRFNARLNGRTNVTAVQGSLYEPVEGRRFDRIVANPPFILGAGAGLVYRDAGPVADGIAWRVARGAADHLEEGGICLMHIHWPLRKGQDSAAVFGPGLADTGADAWVMVTGVLPAARYVHLCLSELHYPRSPAYATETLRNVAFFREREVESIGLGMLVLRRRSGGENWLHIGDSPKIVGSCGDDVERGLRLRGMLQGGLPDEFLLGAKPVALPGLSVTQEAVITEEGWETKSVRLRQSAGLVWEGHTDPVVAAHVARLDGSLTGEGFVAALAEATGRPVDVVRGPVLGTLRTMIELGFVDV